MCWRPACGQQSLGSWFVKSKKIKKNTEGKAALKRVCMETGKGCIRQNLRRHVRATEGFNGFNNTKDETATASQGKYHTYCIMLRRIYRIKLLGKAVGGRGKVEEKGGVISEDVEVGEMELDG